MGRTMHRQPMTVQYAVQGVHDAVQGVWLPGVICPHLAHLVFYPWHATAITYPELVHTLPHMPLTRLSHTLNMCTHSLTCPLHTLDGIVAYGDNTYGQSSHGR